MERTRRIAKWINLRHYRQVYTEIDPEPVRYCLDWDRTKDGRTSNQEGLPAYWGIDVVPRRAFLHESVHFCTSVSPW